MKVDVLPYDASWPESFAKEAIRIRQALGSMVVTIHHIGSTSVPGMSAKPIIDILVEASSLDRMDERAAEWGCLGYECLGEFGIHGRRFYRRSDRSGVRTHHVHVFETDSTQIARHLAFRDYLIAHPTVASQYGALKNRLARQFPNDIAGYMDGKDSFVKLHESEALVWQSTRQWQ